MGSSGVDLRSSQTLCEAPRYQLRFKWFWWYSTVTDSEEHRIHFFSLWRKYIEYIPKKLLTYESLIAATDDLGIFGRDVRNVRHNERLRTECYDWEAFRAAFKMWKETMVSKSSYFAITAMSAINVYIFYIFLKRKKRDYI